MATGRWGKQSAAARAALVELCAVLEKSEVTPALVKRHVYDNLGMVVEVNTQSGRFSKHQNG